MNTESKYQNLVKYLATIKKTDTNKSKFDNPHAVEGITSYA